MSLMLEQVSDGSDESSDRRVGALVGRILAIVVLLVIGLGAPIVLVSTVGLPWPTGAQWAQLRERGRVDTGTVVRIGLAMVAVLWAWFCVSAVHELVTVIGERRSGAAAEAPEHVDPVRPGRRVSWVRRLVRLAVVGGAITAVALAVSSLGEPGGGSRPTSTLLSADDAQVTIAEEVSVAPSTPVPLAPAVSVVGSEPAGSELGGGPSTDVGSARSETRWPVTALGGLAALGVVGVIARRRRHRLRTTVPGDVVAVPPSGLIEVEETVRALAAGEDIARMDLALAVAADALDAAESSALLVSVDSRGEIRMLPTAPALPDGAVWHLDPTDGWWVVPASVDLVDLATAAATVGPSIPAELVELGHLADSSSPDGGARVFIDLTRVRRLDVAGAASADVVRGLCLGLAVADRQCPVRIVTVGLDRPASWSASIRECVSVAEWEHELALLPVAGDDGSESWIGVLPTSDAAAISPERLDRATALITWSDEAGEQASGPRARLLVQGDEATLKPWGLTLVPVRATADVADLVADLVTAPVVETAAVPQEHRAEPSPIEAALALDDPTPSSPSIALDPSSSGPAFIVRLLGPVRVESTDGVVVEFERSKALELVAWLATHRSRPTRGRARAALWEVDVRTATFHNVISDARRSMARLLTPPDGEEWIARSDSEVLPIHPSVVCDLDLIERALESCVELDDAAAIALLRPVVDLLDGPPFSGTDYLWSDSEGISSSAVLAATSVATELARRCLALGDTTGAFAATGRGLAVLPGHEELVSLRMRAHDLAGDRAGVRDEWERYLRVLAADAWPGDGDSATPPPKMLALRRTLLP